MISRLTGKIVHFDPKHIVLDVNGVGYKIYVTADIFNIINQNPEEVTLWTYLAIRETAMDLYGFSTISELNFFELLINTVSGIGPKTAIGILNNTSIDAIITAVQTEDTSHLTKISGISKKIAEKIVLELKDKIEKIEHTPESKSAMKNNSDAIEALKALGYSQSEAREALKEISKNVVSTNEKIREALKILGK